MTARIVNLTTGQITPLQVVWSDLDDEPYRCASCGVTLTDEEVIEHERYSIDTWLCDECADMESMRAWFDRSQEAQDRAVLRGMG